MCFYHPLKDDLERLNDGNYEANEKSWFCAEYMPPTPEERAEWTALLQEQRPRAKQEAYERLKRSTGEDFGLDYDRWKAYLDETGYDLYTARASEDNAQARERSRERRAAWQAANPGKPTPLAFAPHWEDALDARLQKSRAQRAAATRRKVLKGLRFVALVLLAALLLALGAALVARRNSAAGVGAERMRVTDR